MAQAEHKLQDITFSRAVRGYSCEEVDTYLAHVNDQYTALAKECVGLRRKMAAMAAGQNEYREDALREKDKIAAEAQSLIEAGKREADRLVDDAKHKAARLLADAEAAAAGILKQAEEAAANISAAVPEAPAVPVADASAAIAEQSNVADRLVEEIDAFRGEIFAMYARHIEELERLSRLTDKFYETKEALAAGYRTDAEQTEEVQTAGYAETAEEETETRMPENAAAADSDDGEEAAEPVHAEPEADWYAEEDEVSAEENPLAAFYGDNDDDDLLRIDWKAHRASLDPEPEGEAETAAETEAEAEPAEEYPEDSSADRFADLWNLSDADDDAGDEEDLDLTDFLSGAAEETDAFAEPEEQDGPDVLDRLFAADEDDMFDAYTDAYAQEEEPEETWPAADEEAFLSDIASEYLTPKKVPSPAEKKTASAEPRKKAESLDELFESDTVGLTGEFEFIYNSKKSADNVAQIRRQPLVDAQKPEKPKKHGNK